ncbi:serine threonine kinase 10, partial [Cichlidogyrus casuarinus]
KDLINYKGGSICSSKDVVRATVLPDKTATNPMSVTSSELAEIETDHRKRKDAIEERFFDKKQRFVEEHSRAKIKMEEDHIRLRYKLALSRLEDYFMLNRQLLVKRQEMSSQELNSSCDALRERLEADLAFEKKKFQRDSRVEAKRRSNENLKFLRSLNPSLTSVQFRQRMDDVSAADLQPKINCDRSYNFHQLWSGNLFISLPT